MGRLTGGNLSLVQQTIGTPYEIDTRDAILFLEEVRDPMSFVAERLVQLHDTGMLAQMKGIVLRPLRHAQDEADECGDFDLAHVYDVAFHSMQWFMAHTDDELRTT